MANNIIVKAEALQEIDDAFEWYQEQRLDLGYEFLDEIEKSYRQLIANPERYPHINYLYRRIKTDRFPYLIIYEIIDNSVVIFRVRHEKMKPL